VVSASEQTNIRSFRIRNVDVKIDYSCEVKNTDIRK